MLKDEFIDALIEAGWVSSNDAQHEGASELWERLFPTAARMAKELEEQREAGHFDCIREVETLCTAFDHGGNEYNRPANARDCVNHLRRMFTD